MKKVILSIIALGLAGMTFAYKNFNHHGPGHNPPTDDRAANCAPANERLFMEFNNIRALVETGGSLWQDRANSSASYEVPKNSNKFVLYSGALWMGGEDVNGQLKLAAHMFRQGNDFWGGPLGDLIDGTGNYNPFSPQNAEIELFRDYGAAEITPAECLKYDKFFTIRRAEVEQFVAWWNCENNPDVLPEDCEGVEKPNDEVMDRIINWPAHGDPSLGQDFYLAPFYDNNVTGTGIGTYDPIVDGDYPWYDLEDEIDCRNDRRVTLFGDETHWWVFNDKGNIHTESGGDPIGMEVRAQAFAFVTDDEINDMTFYNYELINRGTQTLQNTYFGQWVDPDIGFAANDYVGCDVSRGLGFCFNAESTDNGQGGQDPYGASPPAIGVDFFEGPYKDNDGLDNPLTTDISVAISQEGIPYAGLGLGFGDGVVDNERLGMAKFVYYNNAGGVQGDPNSATEFYNYLNGFWKNNAPFTYGGTGLNGSLETDYCFPGESDPLNWGTAGINPGFDWSEVSEGNPTNNDKRFLQSAGPFTLVPGAVNNITVGVVYGRNTAETDLEASVRTMKAADSKAQALFDNCFDITNPPRAPILTIQEMENELILFLDPAEDEFAWFEEDKINIVTPDELIQQGIEYDDTFRFEGYQIYQMIDAEAAVTDLDDIEKARLVAQCDIQNGVSKLVNYNFDEALNITIPSVKVDGEDEGIRHSFIVKEDLFATGDRSLVNHKKYYYIAVAYAYNNYKTYDPNDPDALDGQKLPYMRSRNSANSGNIESVIGIPHDPSPEADGTVFTTSYGYQPAITQIEGVGNGGDFLRLDSTFRANNVMNWANADPHPTYQPGSGPIDIKVVDPLNLKAGDYTLRFGQDSSSINEDTWALIRSYEGQTDTVYANRTIATRNEQLILEWGLSVSIKQTFYEGSGGASNLYTPPIDATITYKDSSQAWLLGVFDSEANYPTNWIRSGNNNPPSPFDPAVDCNVDDWYSDACHYYDRNLDADQEYEKLLNGTIAPFNRIGAGTYGLPYGFPGQNAGVHWQEASTGAWFTSNQAFLAQTKSSFTELHDVDIILTSDKSMWTRCPVIEMNDNETQTEHGDDILELRSDASIDKNGLSAGDAGYNPAEGELVSGQGMGWFPGYAVDVNTGKRLNMMYSENSWLAGENGNDMIWNPTASFSDQVGNPLNGGMHYVYVFGEDIADEDCPTYDQGAWLMERFSVFGSGEGNNWRKTWTNCMWVWEPTLIPTRELLATDVEINLRIVKPYEERAVNGENNSRPMYQFTIDEPTQTAQGDQLESVLDKINVVPNPYYAYSEYETSKLDNRVKIVNLPERCTITIFNMQGALVRTFEKDDPLTSIDWDLKNHKQVPIAGGLYLIHVKIPVVGANASQAEQERIIKWYGALRPPDLDNL